jgi:hypothetical protein
MNVENLLIGQLMAYQLVKNDYAPYSKSDNVKDFEEILCYVKYT